MLVDIITYCNDTVGLSEWFKNNRPDNVWMLDDGTIKLKANIIGAYYKDNKSFALLRVDDSAIAEGDEETPEGWLLNTPFEIYAAGNTSTDNCPWEKLIDEQIANLVEIKGWATDENGNAIITEIYKPFQFMV